MNKINSIKLYTDFPWVFITPINKSFTICSCNNESYDYDIIGDRGFEVGDGWYDIIYEVCEFVSMLHTTFDISIKIIQVKEKFGELRIYYKLDNAISYVSAIALYLMHVIKNAELTSLTICETCGDIFSTTGCSKTQCVNIKDIHEVI